MSFSSQSTTSLAASQSDAQEADQATEKQIAEITDNNHDSGLQVPQPRTRENCTYGLMRGTGLRSMDEPKRARSWKRWIQPRIGLKNDAPVLYCTDPPSLNLPGPAPHNPFLLARALRVVRPRNPLAWPLYRPSRLELKLFVLAGIIVLKILHTAGSNTFWEVTGV